MELIFALLVAVLPTCASEDSANCYYDASLNGNGQGSSFLDIQGNTIRSGDDLAELFANRGNLKTKTSTDFELWV